MAMLASHVEAGPRVSGDFCEKMVTGGWVHHVDAMEGQQMHISCDGAATQLHEGTPGASFGQCSL